MGKIGKVPPNQCSHTKPLRVKGEKDTTPKIQKKGERARAEMNIHVL